MHTLGESLITALHEQGVRHTFGVPGDFVIGLYDIFERDGRIQPIVMTHEPGAGFAADAYARCKGLGVAMITYCVGGLNCLNAIAGAYAEKSPVLVVSGGPGVSERRTNALLHHRVKTFETQRNVYAEVCCRASIIHSPADAPRIIGETIAAIKRLNRPGYIEIPRDLYRSESGPVTVPNRPLPVEAEAWCESVGEATEMLNGASDPVIIVGIEVHRLRLADKVRQLARRIGAPLVSTLESKSVLAEREVLGIYAGALSSSEQVRQRVEASDCVLMLGAFMTEFDMGVYTAHLDPRRTVSVSSEQCQIRYHTYPQVPLGAFLDGLLACEGLRERAVPPGLAGNGSVAGPAPRMEEKITIKSLYRLIGERLSDEHVVVCDVGDCLFAAIGLHVPNEAGLIAPANYTSMGFGVPGAVGAELALGKRPIVLVGDGAFQMTGTEVLDGGAVRAGADRDRAEQRDVPDARQDRQGGLQPDRAVGLREVHGLDVPGARLPHRDGRAVHRGVPRGRARADALSAGRGPRAGRSERDPGAVYRGAGQARHARAGDDAGDDAGGGAGEGGGDRGIGFRA